MISLSQLATLCGCSYERIRQDVHDKKLYPIIFVYSITEPRTVVEKCVNEVVAHNYLRENIREKRRPKLLPAPRLEMAVKLKKQKLKYEEIGKIMGIKSTTVATLISRAKKRRKILREFYPNDEIKP